MKDENNKKKLYKEVSSYNIEYKKAIKKLIEFDDVNEILSPLTALIMQYIENHLKAILQDFLDIEKTAHELDIDNHKCKNLINSIKKKYNKYLNINVLNNQLIRLEECINYLEGIYGENTMINARYPLASRTLTVNRKEHSVISGEYKLMYTILRYATENLIQFYELEKTYQEIIGTSKPKEKLQDFIEFCDKEYSDPKNIIIISIIKDIDKYNKNYTEN